MKADNHQAWDTRVKIIGAALTLMTILISIFTFTSQQRTNIKLAHDLQAQENSMQFARKTWENQTALCSDLVTLAAKTSVNALNKEIFEKNAQCFEEKYWGSGLLLSDSQLIRALKAFHIEINDFREGRVSAEHLLLRTDYLSNVSREFLAKTKK